MKILFDFQAFNLQKFGGVSRHIVKLMEGLVEENNAISFKLGVRYSNNVNLKNSNLDTTGIEFNKEKDFESFIPWYNWRAKHFIYKYYKKYSLNTYAENMSYTLSLVKEYKPDVFFATYYDPYFIDHLGGIPYVVTLHDMSHEIYAEHFIHYDDRTHEKKRKTLEQAAQIISVSENSKTELLKIYDVEESKIQVIHHGNDIAASLARNSSLSLPENYILYVGNRSFYKNFYLLVFAFRQLIKKHTNLKLLCFGGHKFDKNELNLINSLQLVDSIEQVDGNDSDLSKCYSNAKMLVYPSLSEGFGMPIVEAFSCGCPVVCSDIGCFREIGGELAIYFSPKHIDSIIDSIDKVLRDTKYVLDIKSKIVAYSKKFNWKQNSTKTIELLSKLV